MNVIVNEFFGFDGTSFKYPSHRKYDNAYWVSLKRLPSIYQDLAYHLGLDGNEYLEEIKTNKKLQKLVKMLENSTKLHFTYGDNFIDLSLEERIENLLKLLTNIVKGKYKPLNFGDRRHPDKPKQLDVATATPEEIKEFIKNNC